MVHAYPLTYTCEPLDKEHFWVQNITSSYHRTPAMLRPQKLVPWINPPHTSCKLLQLPSSVLTCILLQSFSHSVHTQKLVVITTWWLQVVTSSLGWLPYARGEESSMGLLSMFWVQLFTCLSHFSVMDLKPGNQFGIKNKCRV